jgi:hypothetical protein
MMQLKGVTITVNYPETTVEAAVPSAMTVNALSQAIRKLCESERDMTSFIVVAAVPVRED